MGPVCCVLACSLGIFCCTPSGPVIEVVEPSGTATSAVIFLHGTAESGPKLKENLQGLIGNFSQYPNTRFIFPTSNAYEFPAFPWNGQVVNMWFSIENLEINGYFNSVHIEESAQQLKKLIEEQVSSGIPHKHICLVGYSSGGIMSMLFGYEYAKNLGCIGAISAYISRTTELYKKLTTQFNALGKNLPPLYMYAGGLDIVCYPSWLEDTARVFKSAGVQVTYNYQWWTTHFINKDGVDGLLRFIEQTIL